MNDFWNIEEDIRAANAFHAKRDAAEIDATGTETGASTEVLATPRRSRTGRFRAVSAVLALLILASVAVHNSGNAGAAGTSGLPRNDLQLVNTQTGQASHMSVTETQWRNGTTRQIQIDWTCTASWDCVETDETVTVWTGRAPAITRSATIRTFPFGWVHVGSRQHLPVDPGTNANRLHEHWLACYLHVGDTSVIACPGVDRYRTGGYPSYTAPKWAYPHGTWPTSGIWHYYTS